MHFIIEETTFNLHSGGYTENVMETTIYFCSTNFKKVKIATVYILL